MKIRLSFQRRVALHITICSFMKKIIYLIGLFCLLGCQEDVEPEKVEPEIPLTKDCFNLNTGISLAFQNAKGDDLLNPTTQKALVVNEFMLYYLVNGKKVIAEDYRKGSRSMMTITETSPHRLRVFTSSNREGLTSDQDGIQKGENIAYLKLNDQITDTIRTQWEAGECYFVNRKLWYNGVLYDPIPEVIEIVK